MVEIVPVRTGRDAEAVSLLAHEFVDWMRQRYPERVEEIDTYLVYQKFEDQISNVRIHYGPPSGECLLARADGHPVGILMLKRTGIDTCEMNRMFVRKRARGMGVGRLLLSHLQQCARDMGFDMMTLSALDRHEEALSLYRSAGFQNYVPAPEAVDANSNIHMRLNLLAPVPE